MKRKENPTAPTPKNHVVPTGSKPVGNTKQPACRPSPAKHWMFTWNNYTEEDLNSVLKTCSNGSNISKYRLQEETGENGTKHIQGYIEFKKKCRPMSYWNKTVHWEPCNNIQASIDYCGKEETRTGKKFTNIADVRIDQRLADFQPRKWQQKLHDMLMEEPDRRTVIWVVDKYGGQGKSLFSKWMAYKYPDVCCMTMNKSADILTMVENYYKTYLIDLPRSYDIAYCPFNALEQIKNGFVTEGKLKKTARVISFAPPHVVIFSNDEPNLSKMSLDRWVIMRLGDSSEVS